MQEGDQMKTFSAFVFLIALSPLVVLAQDKTPPPAKDQKVTVYYFHRVNRCSGCRHAEAVTTDALKENFAAAMEKGTLKFASLAVDGPAAEKAIAEDFGAFGPSVFIAYPKDGKIEKVELDKMWDKLSEGEKAYKAYVAENLKKYLP
jgi:hypothetical protein